MKIINPENIDISKVKNIIFDWGGVITNINYNATIEAFRNLGLNDFHVYFTQDYQNSLFKEFEIGKISSDNLRAELHKVTKKDITDKHIDEAWCAMLLDTPTINIQILKIFGEHFRIFLLSNTNEIHVNYYMNYLFENLNVDYPRLFEKTYFSNEIGLRKPNADIFEYVLNDRGISAPETLFIDDTEMHVDAASKLGFQALLLTPQYTLDDVYRQWPALA